MSNEGSGFEEGKPGVLRTSNPEPSLLRIGGNLFTDEICALIDVPRVGVLGTTNTDGTPLLTPVWYAREGEELWLVIPPDGPKTRNIRRDPRVMFLIMDEWGYTYVTIRGTARLESGEEGAKPREMAIRYLGEEAGAAVRGARLHQGGDRLPYHAGEDCGCAGVSDAQGND